MDTLDMLLFRTGARPEALATRGLPTGAPGPGSPAGAGSCPPRPSAGVPTLRALPRGSPCLLVQNLGGALSPLQLASRGPDELACDHGATPGFCPEMWFSRF